MLLSDPFLQGIIKTNNIHGECIAFYTLGRQNSLCNCHLLAVAIIVTTRRIVLETLFHQNGKKLYGHFQSSVRL